jgi:hypothetical protein
MGEKTNLKCLLGMSVLWVALLSSLGVGKTIYVDDDGPADFNNIQAAIDDANNGDIVIVRDGTYTGMGNRDIDFKGKAIKVQNENGPENCIIDCQGTETEPHRGFYFHSGEDANSILDGFIITNGFGPREQFQDGIWSTGGAIFCNQSSPTIKNCAVIRNKAQRFYARGGGIDCNSSSPRISNCIFTGNITEGTIIAEGGGICCTFDSCPVIIDCNISFNLAEGEYSAGGAIYGGGTGAKFINCTMSGNTAGRGGAIAESSSTYINCTIIDNVAWRIDGDGGGVMCWADNPILINCTIARNHAKGIGGGIYSGYNSMPIITHCTIVDNAAEEYGGGVGCDWSFAFIKSSIVYGNSATKGNQLAAIQSNVYPSIITVSYSNVQSGQSTTFVSGISEIRWGAGNIDSNPCFVNLKNGDYRLLNSSPCIDTAGPYYYLHGQHFADIKGDCRLAVQSVDMGSNEFGSSPDSDADLLSDADENTYGSDPDNPDCDGDGLFDGVEVLRGTNPILADSPTGISVPAQYPVIQQAIFLAFPLETITVSPGIYYENIHLQGKNIVLQSDNPQNDKIVETTIIDGNGFETVVSFAGNESPKCILSGLTITKGGFSGINGNGCKAIIENNRLVVNYMPDTSDGGGGIFNCNGLIQHNNICGNSTAGAGGGISHCSGTIRDNIIAGNFARYGGGGISHCKGLIVSNILKGNLANLYGGGIACYDGNGPTIANCIITGNVARGYVYGYGYGKGGGIFCENSGTRIVNCTIMGNKAYSENVGGGGVCCHYGTAMLENSIVWANIGVGEIGIFGQRANIAVSYSDVQGGRDAVNIYKGEGTLNWRIGNIDFDPCFADVGYWDPNGTQQDANDDFWVDGDYHSRSQAGHWDVNSASWAKDDVTSPCIDAGDPNSPIGFEPFPNGGIINMGAYGGTREASKSYFGKPPCETIVAGDINGDCIVNFLDFAIMAFHWLEER